MVSSKQTPRGGICHAHLFLWLYAVATVWHHTTQPAEIFYFWRQYDPLQTPAIGFAVITSIALALRPASSVRLLWFLTAQLLIFTTRMPEIPTHLFMEGLLNVGMMVVLLREILLRRSLDVDAAALFERYAPLGRWLLLIMYFFGTFHKLNPGFMNPATSCASIMIEGVELPLLDPLWSQYAAIYGTLIFEAIAMILLLHRRWKYWGMLIGLSFHWVIGVVPAGQIAHFSAFAIALHSFFLPGSAAERALADRKLPQMLKQPQTWQMIAAIIIAGQLILAHFELRLILNGLFGLFGVLVIAGFARYGASNPDDPKPALISRSLSINVLSVLFFVHCSGPYIGLNTYGVVSMFSGLRTEGGITNHYFFERPPYLFPYQSKVAYIEHTRDPYLNYYRQEGLGITVDGLQQYFRSKSVDDPLVLPIEMTVGGTRYQITDIASLNRMTDEQFEPHNLFERFYLSFRQVDDALPKKCRH